VLPPGRDKKCSTCIGSKLFYGGQVSGKTWQAIFTRTAGDSPAPWGEDPIATIGRSVILKV
jgi:sugar (pentulose or hexulose) kinase